tara:strand:- start:110 stop:316 length:207 start_codon:yes stop_codon:yes gene_type:complete
LALKKTNDTIFKSYLNYFWTRMILLRLALLFSLTGCASVQTERAITTVQYFAPIAVGVIAIQSFGSSK